MSSTLHVKGATILPGEQRRPQQLLRHPVLTNCSLPVQGCTPMPKQPAHRGGSRVGLKAECCCSQWAEGRKDSHLRRLAAVVCVLAGDALHLRNSRREGNCIALLVHKVDVLGHKLCWQCQDGHPHRLHIDD